MSAIYTSILLLPLSILEMGCLLYGCFLLDAQVERCLCVSVPETMKRIADLPSPLFRSFFNEALRIGEQGYIPTETDVLRARQKSTGITETRFNMGQLS